MHIRSFAEPRQHLAASILRRIVDAVSGARAERIARDAGMATREGQRQLGHVTLVGAGPGDIELLTLRALRTIQRADVILHDALVPEEILSLASARTMLVAVGKRGGRPSCRQSDINQTMADFAIAGRSVVRLKSGDPSIFGRSGEEVSFLRSRGIGVAVVPGVTAASAMAAALGLTLTHRDYAKSVQLVTGHSKEGGIPKDLDWNSIADTTATTVFYMGTKTAGEIVERLLDRGLPSSTPCVAAASVGRPDAEYRACTLATLVEEIDDLPAGSPIIFGIGKVFAEYERSATPLMRARRARRPNTDVVEIPR